MIVIGITGQTGSGKTTVCNILRINDIPVINSDEVAKNIINYNHKCIDEMKTAFPEAFNGRTLNRTILARLVFGKSNEKRLALLNKITHPYIIECIKKRLTIFKNMDVEIAIIDAPLLFESSLHKNCDKTIAVIANETTRKFRIMKRDNIPHDAAKQRIASQNDNDFYIERADFVLQNDDSIENLTNETEKLLSSLKKHFAKINQSDHSLKNNEEHNE